jgi:hypothetical protein
VRHLDRAGNVPVSVVPLRDQSNRTGLGSGRKPCRSRPQVYVLWGAVIRHDDVTRQAILIFVEAAVLPAPRQPRVAAQHRGC